MEGSPPVTIERRESAEYEAREGLLEMAEDELQRAERHVRQGMTEKTVVVLQEEIRVLKSENEKLEKKLRIRSTTLARKLDSNTRWTQVCAVLVLLALVGPTDKLAAIVSWVLDYFAKRAGSKPGG
jgi:hypothetical protein